MKRMMIVAAMLAIASITGTAHADTLLVERATAKPAVAVPARGQTMDQVQATFGTPSQRMEPRGGQKRQWPTIHRWAYPQFVVYFERQRVIDVVAVRADAGEIGPRPPIQ